MLQSDADIEKYIEENNRFHDFCFHYCEEGHEEFNGDSDRFSHHLILTTQREKLPHEFLQIRNEIEIDHEYCIDLEIWNLLRKVSITIAYITTIFFFISIYLSTTLYNEYYTYLKLLIIITNTIISILYSLVLKKTSQFVCLRHIKKICKWIMKQIKLDRLLMKAKIWLMWD